MKQETFMTLFDYLGRPAKLDIAAQVYSAAKNRGIEMKKRSITSNSYTGLVTEYPESFLDKFFGKTRHDSIEPSVHVIILDKLQNLEKKLNEILDLHYNYNNNYDYNKKIATSDNELPF
jgi:hypothetical protein